MINLQRKLML